MLFNPALRVDSSSMYSGDDVIVSQRKVDNLADMVEYDKMRQDEIDNSKNE